MLERLIAHISGHSCVTWVTMEEAAEEFPAAHPFLDAGSIAQ
jgi:hypothetical protein